MSTTFLDSAGQLVRYRIRKLRRNEGQPGRRIGCDIDPHGRNEWTLAASGPSIDEAVMQAMDHWDERSPA